MRYLLMWGLILGGAMGPLAPLDSLGPLGSLGSLGLMTRAEAELSIDVDLSRQAAVLIRDGRPIVTSPISSGKAGHSTPRGQFSVVAKEINHLSATYGQIVDSRGQVIVGDANSSMPIPSGGHFVRAPMPYFLGFTSRHGLHAGYLPGYPASHGCVRMPSEMARTFFETVPIGTPVRVHGEAPTGTSGTMGGRPTGGEIRTLRATRPTQPTQPHRFFHFF